MSLLGKGFYLFTIAHLSDLHLGYRDNSSLGKVGRDFLKGEEDMIPIRELDGYAAWRDAITGIINDNVDAVVIAGDIGHEPNPSHRAIGHMQAGLMRLAEAGIPVYNITGNHDTNDVKGDVAFTRNLHLPIVKIHSHAEPYVSYALNDDIMLHMVSHHMYSESVDVMKQVNPVKGAINILTTHGSLFDPLLKERIRVNDTVREVIIPDSFLQADWDAMMLGHIHERGFVGKESDGIFYNGSLIRRGFSDAEGSLGRGYTLWHIAPDGSVTREMKRVWQRPQEDLPAINAEGLDSVALTEAILANLPDPADGLECDPAVAPILRQRIIGAAPTAFATRDQGAITAASQHALSYALAPRAGNTPDVSPKKDKTPDESVLKPGGLEATYQSWKNESETLNSIQDEEERTRVASLAESYLRKGEEKVFEKRLTV